MEHNVLKPGEGAQASSSLKNQMSQVIRLSIPAILAQISSMAMQYIDAAMVGSLGANASAAIGLVSTSTWLMSGLCISLATGFSVQVAHLIGGGREDEARNVLRQALVCALAMGLLLAGIGMSISGRLPFWLGGDGQIRPDASKMREKFPLQKIPLQISVNFIQHDPHLVINNTKCRLSRGIWSCIIPNIRAAATSRSDFYYFSSVKINIVYNTIIDIRKVIPSIRIAKCFDKGRVFLKIRCCWQRYRKCDWIL